MVHQKNRRHWHFPNGIINERKITGHEKNNINIRNKTIYDLEKKNLSENCHSNGLIVVLKIKLIQIFTAFIFCNIHLDEYSIIWIQIAFFFSSSSSSSPFILLPQSIGTFASSQGPPSRWQSEKILLNFPRNSAGQGPVGYSHLVPPLVRTSLRSLLWANHVSQLYPLGRLITLLHVPNL